MVKRFFLVILFKTKRNFHQKRKKTKRKKKISQEALAESAERESRINGK